MRQTNGVPYTTNYTNRSQRTAWLAILATTLTIGVGALVNAFVGFVTSDRPWLAALVAVPSPVTVFAVFYFLYDRWIWKWPIPMVSSGIPNLTGRWEGRVTFEDLSEATMRRWLPRKRSPSPSFDCQVQIMQTWTRISIDFYGMTGSEYRTHSSVIMAALNTMDYEGGLRYEYAVAPLMDTEGQPLTIGTAHLLIDPRDGDKLRGDYHNRPVKECGKFVEHHGSYWIRRVRG